jgi:dephospho-CoA kinase
MRKAFVAGLTGGIASGKSLALDEFRRSGARVFSCDEAAHRLLRENSRVARAVSRAFADAAAADGSIDRRKLALRAFGNPRDRRRLEHILHPPILRALRREASRARGGVLVCDVPLLFEKRLASLFDATILLCSTRAARLSRLRRYRGLSRSESLSRMKVQWPDRRKRLLADVVIENRGGKADFLRTIRSYGRAMAVISASN